MWKTKTKVPSFTILECFFLKIIFSNSRNNTSNSVHRITEWQVFERACGDHLVQAPHQSRVTQSRLHSTASRQVLNISRAGDSTAPLSSLVQGSVTLKVKQFSLMFMFYR